MNRTWACIVAGLAVVHLMTAADPDRPMALMNELAFFFALTVIAGYHLLTSCFHSRLGAFARPWQRDRIAKPSPPPAEHDAPPADPAAPGDPGAAAGGATAPQPTAPHATALQDARLMLQVRPDATPIEIREAYRQWAKLLHPDRFAASDDWEALRIAGRKFRRLQEARDLLLAERVIDRAA